jgi:hypothetical protein
MQALDFLRLSSQCAHGYPVKALISTITFVLNLLSATGRTNILHKQVPRNLSASANRIPSDKPSAAEPYGIPGLSRDAAIQIATATLLVLPNSGVTFSSRTVVTNP